MTSTRMAAKGKTIRPASVFCKMPALSSVCTSLCTALTSRFTRRAASRIVNGPAPVMARSNCQRFAVRIRNKSSAEAKLIQVPNFLPLKAPNARCLTSSRVATCNVTVFISSPPFINLAPEILQERLCTIEFIGRFGISHVLVIALARLGQDKIQLAAFPFRMTTQNLARHAYDPNAPFWGMLKSGDDTFLATGRPPSVAVCNQRYVFNPMVTDNLDPNAPCPPRFTKNVSNVRQSPAKLVVSLRAYSR